MSASEVGSKTGLRRKKTVGTESTTIKPAADCDVLYDPCLGTPIIDDNPIRVIQQKISALQKKKVVEHYKELPEELKGASRLTLLTWFLNTNFTTLEDINISSILEYTVDSYNYSTDLFESYWDILLALGYIEGYERSENRFMVNEKAEAITRIPELEEGGNDKFYDDPIAYLKERGIKTSSVGGASDITLYYKPISQKSKPTDPCSYEENEVIEGETIDKPRFVFCSSKKFKKEKSIDKYDILNIYGAAKNLATDTFTKEILLLVWDDEMVKKAKENARRVYISEEASRIFGQTTMITGLRKLYDFIKYFKTTDRDLDSEDIRELFGIKSNIKNNLQLLMHQLMAVDYISSGIRKFKESEKGHNRFLVGILPRGGKTYIAGGIIKELQPRVVLVLLGAKSETQSQFIDELFNKFADFNNYEVVDVKEDKEASDSIDKDKHYIFVMSVELFKTEESSITRPLLRRLRGLIEGHPSPVELIISDEAHLKQATALAETATKSASRKKRIVDEETEDTIDIDTLAEFDDIPIVYLTGTFIKPKLAFEIPDDNIIIWDYKDVQMAKTIDQEDTIKYFRNSFGDYFDKALGYLALLNKNTTHIKADYEQFPVIHLMETHVYPGIESIIAPSSDPKTGLPDITTLFTLNKSHDFNNPAKWYRGFQFYHHVRRLLNLIGPSKRQKGDESDHIPSIEINSGQSTIPSMMVSIDRIAQRSGDRLSFVTSAFTVHSQLWFLPKMQGNRLGLRMLALAGSILSHPWFCKHFHVLAVCGENWKQLLKDKDITYKHNTIEIPVGDAIGTFHFDIPSEKSLKERILDIETVAREDGKGLIILAQNMLQLGISLPCVSVVVLLDNNSDVDERIQKMYRGLTQSPNKKDAFIIDLNYFRTVEAVTEYQIAAFKTRHKRAPAKEDLKSIFNSVFDIYPIHDDVTLFNIKELHENSIIELQKWWEESKSKKTGTLKAAGEQINANVDEIISANSDVFNDMNPHKLNTKTKKKLKDIHSESIKKAEALSTNNDEKNEETGISLKKIEDLSRAEFIEYINKQKAYKEIFKIILRYGVFATNSVDVKALRSRIKHDEDFQNEIYEVLVKKGIIKDTFKKETLVYDIILPGLKKILKKEKGNSFITMKEYVNNESKYPDQASTVLEYITEHLAPKEEERKKYGEIFTPLELVDEMLSKLPNAVWSDPELKWLDPANGMGNYPIKAYLGQSEGSYIYPGLFNGLRAAIPDDKKRAKHIVEKMLFMIDINVKNNSIATRLFEKIAPDTAPNIEYIDKTSGFLSAKPLKFNGVVIESFDIIMGNPPYNPPKTATGSSGNSIWQNFVIKSYSILNAKGYLLFVHPPGWKKPTDEEFKEDKFSEGDYKGQIRQGQVWQVLKESGVFKFIYTNDQRLKSIGIDYLPNFPAVDYYVYQKSGAKTTCDTKNVFLGTIEEPKGVRLNFNLMYLPNLITKETQDILHKVTSKEGDKPDFGRFRNGKGFSVDSSKGKYKYIYTYNKNSEPKYQYSDIIGDNNINFDKVIMSFDGGIDCFTVQYVKKEDRIGSYEMTMYSKVDSDTEGRRLERFFNSDIVKFIFLITQYASGKMTKNEPLVANSITIPPEKIKDYYKFFDIEEHKKYIEEILAHYEQFKTPKRKAKTAKSKGGRRLHSTRKIKRASV